MSQALCLTLGLQWQVNIYGACLHIVSYTCDALSPFQCLENSCSSFKGLLRCYLFSEVQRHSTSLALCACRPEFMDWFCESMNPLK